jgi:hypothetical protein
MLKLSFNHDTDVLNEALGIESTGVKNEIIDAIFEFMSSESSESKFSHVVEKLILKYKDDDAKLVYALVTLGKIIEGGSGRGQVLSGLRHLAGLKLLSALSDSLTGAQGESKTPYMFDDTDLDDV